MSYSGQFGGRGKKIGSADITDATITAADLAADSVEASEIAAGAVGTSEIADGSIVSTDIQARWYEDDRLRKYCGGAPIAGNWDGLPVFWEPMTGATTKSFVLYSGWGLRALPVCLTSGTRRYVWTVETDAVGGKQLLTASHSGNNCTIEYLATPDNPAGVWVKANGAAVLDATGAATLQRSVCPIGDGKVLYLSYGTALTIYYSIDGGVTWGNNSPTFNDGHALLTATDALSITHFHGAVWDDTNSTLWVMTGDGDTLDSANSLLICDDLADLVANPGTWITRWGLDVHGAARAAYLAANPTYCVTYGGSGVSSDVKTVDVLFSGDYAFWVTDTRDTFILRAPRTAVGGLRQAEVISTIKLGLGWYGCVDADGRVLLTSGTYPGQPNDSEYFRVYCIDTPTSAPRVLAKWLKGDRNAYDNVPHIAGSGEWPQCVEFLLGRMWIGYTGVGGSAGSGLNHSWLNYNGTVGRV
ncbi:MAG: hypothetical protein V2A79_14700, partial [Planctomycetota bacterium]